MKIQLIPPLKDIMINQPFGVNWVRPGFYKELGLENDLHNGIDLETQNGCPVVAMHDGTVTWADKDGTGGISINLISIKQGGGFYTIYYHLQDVTVKVGDIITAGKLIGHADNTGTASTGSHLHIGLKRTLNAGTICMDNGYKGAIDPAPYFPKDWDKSNAFKRYGRKRNFINEVKVMIALRSYLKRNPSFEQINACTYGAWDRETVKDDGQAYNWKYLTKNEFKNGKKPFC